MELDKKIFSETIVLPLYEKWSTAKFVDFSFNFDECQGSISVQILARMSIKSSFI